MPLQFKNEDAMMVELTIQMPSQVARRLEPIRDRLPALLLQIAEMRSLFSAPSDVIRPASVPLAYVEVLDFLAGDPSLQEIMSFKVSEEAQDRLRELLDKNREDRLTNAEEAELNLYEQIEHVMILLKAHAHALAS